MLTVKTKTGTIPAELVKTNNKTAIVKVSKTVSVKGTTETKTVTKHIKRDLTDLVET